MGILPWVLSTQDVATEVRWVGVDLLDDWRSPRSSLVVARTLGLIRHQFHW